MRKFLQYFGIFSLVFFFLAFSAMCVANYKLHAIEAQSKDYLDSTLPALAEDWNQQRFVGQAAPSLFQDVTPEQEGNLFFQLSLLGPLIQYDGSTLVNCVDSTKSVTAEYTAKAKFRTGTFVFNILLIRTKGRWLIAGFHVNKSA